MPRGDEGPNGRRPLRAALDPVAQPYYSGLTAAASMAKEVIMGGLGSDYRRSESMRILSDRKSLLCPFQGLGLDKIE